MGQTQSKKQFLLEITKPDPKLSKPFYFNKISYVWLSYECFYILCNTFLLKSVIAFPAITAVMDGGTSGYSEVVLVN